MDKSVGVVVTTCQEHKHTWLLDCLSTLKDVPVAIHWNDSNNNHYEAGGLETGLANFSRFWLIPDTVVVKNLDLMWHYLKTDDEYCLGPGFISCIGIITWSGFAKMSGGLPAMPRNKHEAVDIELSWFSKYAAINCSVIDPTFHDGPIREWRHGRENMVLDSPILTKYKGTWDRSMIK